MHTRCRSSSCITLDCAIFHSPLPIRNLHPADIDNHPKYPLQCPNYVVIVQIRTSTGSQHDIIALHQALNHIRQLSRPSPNRPKKNPRRPPLASGLFLTVLNKTKNHSCVSRVCFLAHSLVLTGPLFLITRHAVCHLTSPLRPSIHPIRLRLPTQ